MLALLKRYWSAVAEVFPEAWDASPRRSRLVHGVGIRGLGCLMDEISYELREEGIPSARLYAEHLRLVAEQCLGPTACGSSRLTIAADGTRCRTPPGTSRP